MVSDQLLSVSVELSFFFITAVSANKAGRWWCMRSARAVQAQCKRSTSAVQAQLKG
jgi:hypothetical protein